MKRLYRPSCNLVFLLTTALLLLCAAAWFRSYFVTDVLSTTSGFGSTAFWTLKGDLLYEDYWAPRLSRTKGWHYTHLSHQFASDLFAPGENPYFHPRYLSFWKIFAFLALLETALFATRKHLRPGCDAVVQKDDPRISTNERQ